MIVSVQIAERNTDGKAWGGWLLNTVGWSLKTTEVKGRRGDIRA